MQPVNDYIDALMSAFRGEATGVALFRRFSADHGHDRQHRLKLLVGECIEEQTREQLRALLREAGVDPEDPDLGDRADEIARPLADVSWLELAAWHQHGVDQARPVYLRVRDTAPDPDHQLVRAVIDHVEAMYAFMSAEAAGRPHGSEAPVIAVLGEDYRQRLRAAGATYDGL